jgi:hypothetical protein
MTTISLRYTLEQVEDICFQGFDYQIPENVIETISNLAMQVGSPDYVKTPAFKKRENPMKIESSTSFVKLDNKKKRGNKNNEVINDDDWNAIRTPFEASKIQEKSGVAADFDVIRTFINKMTDKNYIDMRNTIIEIVKKSISINSESDISNIGNNIFDIASSNRYYSKIYADLYSDLSQEFEFIKEKYRDNFERFTDLFDNIEYVDPNVDYDRFCEINKINEKRKSLAAFYVNLMNNKIIPKAEIMCITRKLLANVYNYISIENKKNEVDELTETVAILYKAEIYEDDEGDNYEMINGFTIGEIIEKIAMSKVKDYKSLTNKSLFKFMDLIDM